MNDNLKQNLDEIAADLSKARQNNAPTYWLMLIFAGTLVTALITLFLTKTGIVLLVTSAFVYMANNILNSWLEIRKAEKAAEAAKPAKPAKKMPPPVVVEASKDKEIRVNLKRHLEVTVFAP